MFFHGFNRFSLAFVVPFLAASAMAQATNPVIPPARYQTITPGLTLHELSPVEYFRVLLGMTVAERDRVLSAQSPEQRKAVLSKIQEYEGLPKEIRETRLHQTELQWELRELMKLPAEERVRRLKETALENRSFLTEKLQQWDALPAATKKLLLEKQNFIGLYLRLQDGSPDTRTNITKDGARRWADELHRWQALPVDRRQELCAAFRSFFQMDGLAQKRMINELSDTERRQMERALASYAKLPPEQRARCIGSFQKFATMAPEERDEFLKNARSWENMPSRQRKLWRELVQKLPAQPPLPPGLGKDMPPLPAGLHIGPPPLPPSTAVPSHAVMAEATNGWH